MRLHPNAKTAPRGRELLVQRIRGEAWTVTQAAQAAGVSRRTAFKWLARFQSGRRDELRDRSSRPRELLHIDIKKLGRIKGTGHRIHGNRWERVRGIGWEFAHVCVDDHTRLAYVEVAPDERKEAAVGFLSRALAWFSNKGVVSTSSGVIGDSFAVSQECFPHSCRKYAYPWVCSRMRFTVSGIKSAP